MESRVQVAGRLNTPAYAWPLRAGIVFWVLAPISHGLRLARRRRGRRVRGVLGLLRLIGPSRFLIAGAVAFLFALAVRRARMALRRDLEIAPGRFTIFDRRGRREFEDAEVQALAFRSRSAAVGTVALQRGRASLWVDGREGPDRLELDWEYPDHGPDPMAGFLGRIADLVHSRIIKAIDSGLTIEGEGWELSRMGLRAAGAFEDIPFDSIDKAEYHDGQLMIWTKGAVEPSVRIAEGTRNDAILHAILIERMPPRNPEDPASDSSPEGLGRVLFERRPTNSENLALWGLAMLLTGLFAGLALVLSRLGVSVATGLTATALVSMSFIPALMRHRELFRFHEHGVTRAGLSGTRELPFADLAEIRYRPELGQQRLRVTFRPIPGRGRKPVSVTLRSTDEALETIRTYTPVESPTG